MSGFPRSGLSIFIFVAGGLHLLQILATHAFVKPLRTRGNKEIEGVFQDVFFESIRRGLILSVLGSGILVMLNARSIAQGGALATSLCLLFALLFFYRLYIQIFRFSKLIRLGASRFYHLVLVFVLGIASFFYTYAMLVLFLQ